MVLDFGIAQMVGSVSESASTEIALTTRGAILGTPGYLAPEQAVGSHADTRADIWSFGALLFEMLARRPAFLRTTVQETLAAVITGQTPLDGCTVAPATVTESPSLVVLPFENLGGGAENESFTSGLTEEVIGDLANIADLRVFSRATALRYRAERRDASLASRELRAGYVLDGSVRRAGANLRVVVQLVEAARDTPVWADKYAGTLEDVFTIQETISRSIASALRLKLAAAGDRHFAQRRQGSAAAYDAYLSTRTDVESFTLAGLDRARVRLERALAELGPDPYLYRGLGRIAWQYVNAGVSHDSVHHSRLDDCIRQLDAIDPGGAHGLALRASRAMISGDIGA